MNVFMFVKSKFSTVKKTYLALAVVHIVHVMHVPLYIHTYIPLKQTQNKLNNSKLQAYNTNMPHLLNMSIIGEHTQYIDLGMCR